METANVYLPQKAIVSYIDDYVAAIFQHAPYADAGRSHPKDVKNMAYSIIPNIKPLPFTHRTVAVGAVYCAFILCDSRISQGEINAVSKRSTRLRTVSVSSISKGARYIRDFNKLDIIW